MQPSISETPWRIINRDSQIIYVHPQLTDKVDVNWFSPSYWQNENAISGESKGRYTTYFIRHQQDDQQPLHMVLRHYYRGGLMAKLSKDKFVYSGLQKTRAIAELELLQHMVNLDLPVPKPLAALVTKTSPWFCTNDILIERIPDVQDGFQMLTQQALSDQLWFNIGHTIKRFHDQGIYHSDLNIHNILLGKEEQVFIIDFDKCGIRSVDAKWPQANLSRLLRSLNKEKSLNPDFNFDHSDWPKLLEGYNA